MRETMRETRRPIAPAAPEQVSWYCALWFTETCVHARLDRVSKLLRAFACSAVRLRRRKDMQTLRAAAYPDWVFRSSKAEGSFSCTGSGSYAAGSRRGGTADNLFVSSGFGIQMSVASFGRDASVAFCSDIRKINSAVSRSTYLTVFIIHKTYASCRHRFWWSSCFLARAST